MILAENYRLKNGKNNPNNADDPFNMTTFFSVTHCCINGVVLYNIFINGRLAILCLFTFLKKFVSPHYQALQNMLS